MQKTVFEPWSTAFTVLLFDWLLSEMKRMAYIVLGKQVVILCNLLIVIANQTLFLYQLWPRRLLDEHSFRW